MNKIKGILIDSGRVLNVSTTGNWSFSPNFFKIVGTDIFYDISKKKRKIAFAKAWKYIDSIKIMKTIEEEYEHFSMFFTIISDELPQLKIDDEKKKLLIDDFVLNFEKYTFFDDVFEILPKLSKDYKLCLVSDAWPSLREVYKKAGIYNYFDSMIISSELGVTKPSEKMYVTALKKLELNKDEVVFIDDNTQNCNGAFKLGIKAIILNRNLIMRIYSKFILKVPYKVVKNLYGVDKFIGIL